jgi:hypothetical protein
MLIIKRVDGKIRYAYDGGNKTCATTTEVEIERAYKTTPQPFSRGNCKPIGLWYLQNKAMIHRVLDTYTTNVEAFIEGKNVCFNPEQFQEYLIEAMYWSSSSRLKTFV